MTLQKAQARARAVLLELEVEVEDGKFAERLFAATGRGLDELADGLLDDIGDALAQEFDYQRRRMDGDSHKRLISTQLRRSLNSLDLTDLYDITTSLIGACKQVLAFEAPLH